MNNDQLRAFLNLMMVSDPWPLTAEERVVMVDLATTESVKRGFPDWIAAYHQLPPWAERDELARKLGAAETEAIRLVMAQERPIQAALINERDELKRRLAESEAACAELLSTLTPFVRLWDDSLELRASVDAYPVFGIQGNVITVGDIRRAVGMMASPAGRTFLDAARNCRTELSALAVWWHRHREHAGSLDDCGRFSCRTNREAIAALEPFLGKDVA